MMMMMMMKMVQGAPVQMSKTPRELGEYEGTSVIVDKSRKQNG